MNDITYINTETEETVINGNGFCQVSGCSCPSFVDVAGKWPSCDRCGHQFSEHY